MKLVIENYVSRLIKVYLGKFGTSRSKSDFLHISLNTFNPFVLHSLDSKTYTELRVLHSCEGKGLPL